MYVQFTELPSYVQVSLEIHPSFSSLLIADVQIQPYLMPQGYMIDPLNNLNSSTYL